MLGYGPVHRYVGGKADWSAAGWEREGRLDARPFAGDLADRSVPTCTPDERVGEVHARVTASGWDRAVVVGNGGVVLGMLSGPRLLADAQLPAELGMDSAPSTFRPSLPARELRDYMREKNVQDVLVSDSDGVLLGALDRRTVEESVHD
jgi:CBS domain-containing protein